jgi:hypothetical protein
MKEACPRANIQEFCKNERASLFRELAPNPSFPSPLGERVRVRGIQSHKRKEQRGELREKSFLAMRQAGFHPHLNPPPSRDKLGICDKGEEIFFEKS